MQIMHLHAEQVRAGATLMCYDVPLTRILEAKGHWLLVLLRSGSRTFYFRRERRLA